MTQLAPFQDKTLTEVVNSLAAFLPNDDLFRAKNIKDTNLRLFLEGLAPEILRFENTINAVVTNFDINQTIDFLPEFEAMFGLPDDCSTSVGTVEERRERIILRIAAQGASTQADFEALGQKFGVQLTVSPGGVHAVFPIKFPWLFVDSIKTAKFTLLVTTQGNQDGIFPVTFPWPFGVNFEIKCLFSKLIPANTQLIFIEEGDC